MSMNRRMFSASAVFAGLATVVGRGTAAAQFTEQEVRNGASVVATGDVDLNQSASGSQIVDINGTPIDGNGIYQTTTGQVVVNDGQVVATGDVAVNQSASGTQTVSAVFPEYDGQPAGSCSPGAVLANPDTGQVFYQANDCCWYAACANRCQSCETCVG